MKICVPNFEFKILMVLPVRIPICFEHVIRTLETGFTGAGEIAGPIDRLEAVVLPVEYLQQISEVS